MHSYQSTYIDHVVPDELHLFLEILIESWVSDAVELDITEKWKQADLFQGATLNKGQAGI